MSHFVKYPGSPGTWDAEQNTLTITLGETAQLLLVGDGPPGQEKLNIVLDGAVTSKLVQEFPLDVPNQRLIGITPEKVGDTCVQARLPNNGLPYTQVLRLVVLPRQPSPLGPETVILFTLPLKGDERNGVLGRTYGKAVRSSPEATVVVVQSYAEFVTLLTAFRDTGRRIGRLEVFSQGAPGCIGLAQDVLDTAGVRALRGRGFNTVFAPGARIFFGGCNLADGVKGVTFLKEFGTTFLLHAGGSVAATTSLGLALGRYPGNGKTHLLWGDTVRLVFDTAGKVIEATGIDDPAALAVVIG
jgi:hypothetical protein